MNATRRRLAGRFRYSLSVLCAALLLATVLVAVSGVATAQVAPVSPNFVTQWGGNGTANGQFSGPQDAAVGSGGSVYVIDKRNDRIQKFTSSGVFVMGWDTFGHPSSPIHGPRGIAADANGNVYVTYIDCPAFDGRVGCLEGETTGLAKYDSRGNLLANRESVTGGSEGQLNMPSGLAVDPAGNVYVADALNHRVQKFAPDGTFAVEWGTSGSGEGQFVFPQSVAVDGAGDVYVADTGNDRIQKFSSSGTFLAAWGASGTGNGQLDRPGDLATDASGSVYVADTGNHRLQRFTPEGVFVAKWGAFGTQRGQFRSPEGVAVDRAGDIYVADTGNGRVQKFSFRPPSKPRVTATVPAPAKRGVFPASNVTATFSENMEPGSVNRSTFRLFARGSTASIPATVAYNAATRKATLDPAGRLGAGRVYRVVISAGARDLVGWPLDQVPATTGNQSKMWSFTTRR